MNDVFYPIRRAKTIAEEKAEKRNRYRMYIATQVFSRLVDRTDDLDFQAYKAVKAANMLLKKLGE